MHILAGERRRVADIEVTIRGTKLHLRRAVLVGLGKHGRDARGVQVQTLDGVVIVKESRSYCLKHETSIEDRIAAVQDARRWLSCLRRIRRAGVTVRNAPWPSTSLWETLARLAESGAIVAIDCSPRSESTYVAPQGADISEANRGPDGAYAGWMRWAWHGRAAHQECRTVETAEALERAVMEACCLEA